MRFRNLKGLTSLPIEAIKHRFRNEDVLTVLPVSSSVVGRESLFIATPSMLAIVTGHAHHESEEWMTQLAPWDVVRLADGRTDAEDDTHRLVVHVGSLTFEAALSGPEGQKALRHFVTVAEAQHEALAAPT